MQWFKNQKMAVKLTLGFGVSLLLTVTLGVVAVQQMKTMNDVITLMYQKDTIGLVHIKEANVNLVRSARALRNAILDDTAEAMEQRRADMLRFQDAFRTAMKEFEKTIVSDQVRRATEEGLRKYEPMATDQQRVWELTRAGKNDEARAALKGLQPPPPTSRRSSARSRPTS